MRFSPFVTDSDGNLVSVTIAPLSSADAEQTNLPPRLAGFMDERISVIAAFSKICRKTRR